ncbi:MAG: hypothetical protein V2A70_05045, partial [Candidatus Omnitrophota bacterium]
MKKFILSFLFLSAFAPSVWATYIPLSGGSNIGIGTTNPNALLQVGAGTASGDADLSSNSALIKGNLEVDGKIYGDGSQLTGVAGAVSGLTNYSVPRSQADGKTLIDSGIYMDANGNVGIGTIYPVSRIDIAKPTAGNVMSVTNLVSGDVYKINNAGTTFVQNLQFGNVLSPAGWDGLDITSTATNKPGTVRIYPHGSSYSSLEFYITDASASLVNFSRMRWDANLAHSGAYTFLSEAGGTGTVKPIYFRMNSTDIMVLS